MKFILYPVFLFLFTVIMAVADLSHRLARNDDTLARRVIIQNRCVLGLLRLFGIRLELGVVPDINPGLPLVIVSNHQSIFDIPITSVLFAERLPGFVAKKELKKGALGASVYLRSSYNALIDRKNGGQAIKAIIRLGKSVNSRTGAVVLFPEGTRSKNGELGEFKSKGFEGLVRTLGRAILVDVAISGSWQLALKPIPFGCTVRARVSEPREVTSEDNLAEVLKTSQNWIGKHV